MEQFSLEKYLENPSRKITTRYGDREVRIICTDRKAKLPIVALMVDMDGNEYVTYHTTNGWCNEEEKYSDKRDLFFADEREELTEFDYAILSIISDHNSHTDSIEAFAKRSSKKLLDLARKELEPELDKKLKEAYNQDGLDTQEEITKCLPKWKKDCFHNIISVVDGRLFYNGYYIDINELEKLPKEE